ncbi:hypothetical protein M1D88_07870 [Arthrobacter sp. R1-13]
MNERDNAGQPPEDAADPEGRPPAGASKPANIREEQQTHAGGTVPAAYVGSGDPGQEHKPEQAVEESGTWDDEPQL